MKKDHTENYNHFNENSKISEDYERVMTSVQILLRTWNLNNYCLWLFKFNYNSCVLFRPIIIIISSGHWLLIKSDVL